MKELGVTADDPVLLPKLLQHGRNCGNERLLTYLFRVGNTIREKVAMCNALETCDQVIADSQISTWKRVTAALQQPCCCDRTWAPAAREILRNNDIAEGNLCVQLRRALIQGMQKKGDANCLTGAGNEGKSFILRPLSPIFQHVFACPARVSYPLLDLPQSQVVILDDWRPDPGALDVSSTLLWLESATLRINRPLNLYCGHLDFRPTQPTFLTCNWQSLFVAKGRWSESELLMLRSRLSIYRFHHRIGVLRNIPPCPCCFAMWLISGGKDVAKLWLPASQRSSFLHSAPN